MSAMASANNASVARNTSRAPKRSRNRAPSMMSAATTSEWTTIAVLTFDAEVPKLAISPSMEIFNAVMLKTSTICPIATTSIGAQEARPVRGIAPCTAGPAITWVKAARPPESTPAG